MDKREEKSIKAIHQAFVELVNEKRYEDIVIQDILDKSRVSRSTFYSHFKTKDDLLIDISNHIFEHVFSKTLEDETSHDFSHEAVYDYKHLVTHLFYHIRDEQELFKGLFKSNGINIYLNELRTQLKFFVNSYYNNYSKDSKTPLELRKTMVIEDFIVILNYWIKNNFKETPEEIGEYYIENLK